MLTSIGKSDIIIEVNGIGYLLSVSSKLISSLGNLGSNLSLFTDLQIKDDKIYNTLTNSLGHFEFYLPFGTYTITMDEGILNERFRVTSNNLPIKLRNKQDGVYVSFYIIEKRRKVIFKDFTKKKND